jgi:GrpB-like predicted nucleotidyltransferase (UPF0157 family)
LFAAEARWIGEKRGTLALRIEHIGGTSIPGMCAKPILDILAGRPAGTAPKDYVIALKRAGYDHRGEHGVPGRQYFRRGEPMGYHVHLVEESGPLWRDYLAFRDYLRAHPYGARQFADLKRTLVARFPLDREAYTNAKTARVQEILVRANQAAQTLAVPDHRRSS